MKNQITANHHWCKTALGTDVSLYQKTHTTQKKILFIGGVHGDEPEGVRLAQELLNELTRLEEANISTLDWLLIPCLNPDGFSKNLRTNARGVDLNRNFPSANWSPSSKEARYYPGAFAGSEPEVAAVVELLRLQKIHLIVHFHSWKPCIVYTGKAGMPVAQQIGQDCGYEAREDIGYPTPGSLGEYGWNSCGIPVICIEEQEGAPLETVWPRFRTALRNLVIVKD